MSPCFHLELSHGQARRTVRSQEDALKNREASTFHNFHARFLRTAGRCLLPRPGQERKGTREPGTRTQSRAVVSGGAGRWPGKQPIGSRGRGPVGMVPKPTPGMQHIRPESVPAVSDHVGGTFSRLSEVSLQIHRKFLEETQDNDHEERNVVQGGVGVRMPSANKQ